MELEETNITNNNNTNGVSDRLTGGVPSDARFRGWNHHHHGHSSRIIRVSRATGGKDRHSKVMTSKGPRDRRVRLSVSTAIQFYDLQDRLGFDQPSKAVEWLIKAASESIAELPSLNAPLADEKMASNDDRNIRMDSAEADLNHQNHNQNQNMSVSKSTCSSTSETSKNSGLSLSRSENRVKARERARERVVAKEKECSNNCTKNNGIANSQDMNSNTLAQNPSFTELLNAGLTSGSVRTTAPTNAVNPNRQWAGPPSVEYFPNQVQLLGNSLIVPPPFGLSSDQDHHQEPLQPFSVVPDQHHHHHHHHHNHHLISTVGPAGGGSYNLDFNIASPGSLAGFNRGTLQSNSLPLFGNHLLQRISSSSSSSTASLFIGPQAMENQHHHQQNFPAGFDGRLQIYYHNNGSRNSDQKGTGKR